MGLKRIKEFRQFRRASTHNELRLITGKDEGWAACAGGHPGVHYRWCAPATGMALMQNIIYMSLALTSLLLECLILRAGWSPGQDKMAGSQQ